jgi:hypothetical protein
MMQGLDILIRGLSPLPFKGAVESHLLGKRPKRKADTRSIDWGWSHARLPVA